MPNYNAAPDDVDRAEARAMSRRARQRRSAATPKKRVKPSKDPALDAAMRAGAGIRGQRQRAANLTTPVANNTLSGGALARAMFSRANRREAIERPDPDAAAIQQHYDQTAAKVSAALDKPKFMATAGWSQTIAGGVRNKRGTAIKGQKGTTLKLGRERDRGGSRAGSTVSAGASTRAAGRGKRGGYGKIDRG